VIWTIVAVVAAFFILRFLWRMLHGAFALSMEIERMPVTEKELARGRRVAGILLLLVMFCIPVAVIIYDMVRRLP
jgi:peptidoglycan/LPS O-acetylase OafA/YrhL